MNESNGKTTREWIKECESLRAKLEIAVKALNQIINYEYSDGVSQQICDEALTLITEISEGKQGNE
jgi:hypothetical protein